MSDMFASGNRVAFRDAKHVYVWSRATRRLRRLAYRCHQNVREVRVVVAGATVYWECDAAENVTTHARGGIFAGVPGRSRAQLVRASQESLSLWSDGRDAYFLSSAPARVGVLWRLAGAGARAIARAEGLYGSILDASEGKVLIWRWNDDDLVLYTRSGRRLHAFSDRFDCCTDTGGTSKAFFITGRTLVTNSANAIEVYDVPTETLRRRFPIANVSLLDVEGRFVAYAVSPGEFRVLNLTTRQTSRIAVRGNSEPLPRLTSHGVYYVETFGDRTRLRHVPYSRLSGGSPSTIRRALLVDRRIAELHSAASGVTR